MKAVNCSNYLDKRKAPLSHVDVTNNLSSPPSNVVNTSSSHKSAVAGSVSSVSKQPLIEAALTNQAHVDICRSNNAMLEMVIADCWHCNDFANATVESARFARVIKLARLVGNDFKIPHRKKIRGPLLELNFKTCLAQNEIALLKDASAFGLTFLGDGATIKRMPLINTLAMCGDSSPMVMSIVDCTDHMAAGGLKDCVHIANLFSTRAIECDPDCTLTDVFFFDGAGNMQKGGRF